MPKSCLDCNHRPNIKKRKTILFGYTLSIGFSSIMLITFFKAYFNDTYKVIVDVNYFGEANLEAIVVPIVFAVILIGYYYVIKQIKI